MAKVLNKKNLKEKDLKVVELLEKEMNLVIADALFEYTEECSDGSETLKKIKYELIESFCEKLRIKMGDTLQELISSYIDNYGEEDGK